MGSRSICERCSQIAHRFSFVISALASHDGGNEDTKDSRNSLTWRRLPCWTGRASQTLPDDLREVLEEQRELRGAPLYPYLFYARNPAYFRAAHAMWTTLQQETKRVPGTLRTLLNRRVASWNNCAY